MKNTLPRHPTAMTSSLFWLIPLIGAFLCADPLLAQAGQLDLAFGQNGSVTTDFNGWGDSARAIEVQADGKVVVAGSSYAEETSQDFALTRYYPDGSLDTGFGVGGKVTTDFISSASYKSYDMVEDIAIQKDGKIIVAGWTMYYYYTWFSVARYNADGSVDPTFGRDGRLRYSGPICCGAEALAVALQDDGKIIVTGQYWSRLLVVRFNSDGTLDTGFGRSGYFEGTPDLLFGKDIVLGENRIYVAARSGYSPSDIALVGLTYAGQLDTLFGTNGIARADLSYIDHPMRVALWNDSVNEKIIVGGFAYNSSYDIALVRFNSDGNLDPTFGGSGLVLTDLGIDSEQATGLAVQADGRIVISTPGNSQVTVIRYNSNGTLDLGFGTGGIATTQIGTFSTALDVTIQFDGKILAAGGSDQGTTGSDFAVARFEGISNPLQSLESLVGQTQDLLTTEQLSGGEISALQAKLRAALQLSDDNRLTAAMNCLKGYVNQLEALILGGILAEVNGQPLIDRANAVITMLQAA